MGYVSIGKLGLILLLLLTLNYLVEGFRLIQEKSGKPDKPTKKIDDEKDGKEKYANQTVTVHFKIPSKIKEDSAKYDKTSVEKGSEEVSKPKIVIAKKPTVNNTKVVLEKLDKAELTEKIKAKILENVEKETKPNITKSSELKKASKTESVQIEQTKKDIESKEKPITENEDKPDVTKKAKKHVSEDKEKVNIKTNITKILELKKSQQDTSEEVKIQKQDKKSSDKNILEKSKLIQDEEIVKMNITKMLDLKKAKVKETQKDILPEPDIKTSGVKKKIQDEKAKEFQEARKVSQDTLLTKPPTKIITSIVRKAKENETSLPSVKETIKQKIEAGKIMQSKVSEEKPKILEEKQKIIQDKPKVIEEKPKIIKEEPKIKLPEEKQKIIQDKPNVIEEKPKITKEEPKIKLPEEKQKIIQDKPKLIEEKPKIIKEEPKTVEKTEKPKKEVDKPISKPVKESTVKLSTTKQPSTTTKQTPTVTKSPTTTIKIEHKDVKHPQKLMQDDKTVVKNKVEVIEHEFYHDMPAFIPNFDLIQNVECKNQGMMVIEQMKNHKLWAMRMLDASAKIPSGILKGNLNQLGDYDQCLGIYAKVPPAEGKNDDKELRISGKYCLAAIDIEATVQDMKLPVNLAQGRAFLRSKNSDPGHFIPRFTTIQWGVCVPAVCTSEDVQKSLEHYLTKNNSMEGVRFDVLVEQNQCFVKKPPRKIEELKYETVATIGLLTMIVVTTVVATLRDLIYTKEDANEVEISKSEKIFMSFSLKRTLNSFLQDPENDDINCIHGIRAISTLLLYIAHKLIPVGHSPYTNKILLTEVSNHPLSILLRMSVIYTDTFLLLSGILTAYHMSKDMENRGHIPWVNRIFARLIRLTPTLLVVLLYYAYVMDMTGEGPLWNTVVERNAELCQDSWWKNLIYIQNIYPFEEMCATHTHQLALDMQLFLVAPILVWFLYRRPFLGVFTTLLLHSLSVILRYYTTLNYRLSLVIYHGISISQLYRTANLLYASTLHRATPYVAGVGLGVLLRQLNPEFRMPKVLSVTGWLMTGYFISWTFYTPSHLSSRNYLYDVHEAAQYAALCSLAWALALSWIIFASYANYEGYLNSILSSRPMILLSKLSYTMYLTQFIVFFYNVGVLRTPSEFHVTKILNISELAVVITLSVVLLLLVDLPVQKIKNILMKPSKQSEKPEEIDETPRKGSSATESDKSDN